MDLVRDENIHTIFDVNKYETNMMEIEFSTTAFKALINNVDDGHS